MTFLKFNGGFLNDFFVKKPVVFKKCFLVIFSIDFSLKKMMLKIVGNFSPKTF